MTPAARHALLCLAAVILGVVTAFLATRWTFLTNVPSP
jgi:hypothetical protein